MLGIQTTPMPSNIPHAINASLGQRLPALRWYVAGKALSASLCNDSNNPRLVQCII